MKILMLLIMSLVSMASYSDAAAPMSISSLVHSVKSIYVATVVSGRIIENGYIYSLSVDESIKGKHIEVVELSLNSYTGNKFKIGVQYLFFVSEELLDPLPLFMEFDEDAAEFFEAKWLKYDNPFDYVLPKDLPVKMIHLDTSSENDEYYGFYSIYKWYDFNKMLKAAIKKEAKGQVLNEEWG